MAAFPSTADLVCILLTRRLTIVVIVFRLLILALRVVSINVHGIHVHTG
jgi:hypothetical protein